MNKQILIRVLVPSALALGFVACDLEPKDIGDESESDSGSASDSSPDSDSDSESDSDSDPSAGSASGSGSTSGPGGVCEPGDMRDADDGCNTCTCTDDGFWACTEIGCEPTECEPGDTRDAEDGCNTCSCDDAGMWACTDQACETECEPGDTQPAKDGCNTCFCDDDGTWGSCTEIACPPFDPFNDTGLVGVCEDSVPFDALEVLSVELTDPRTALLQVSYSGGCAEHLLGGCWDGAWTEGVPVGTTVNIAHDWMDDPCDGIVNDEVVLDISPVIESFQELYPGDDTFVLTFGTIQVEVSP